MTRTSRTWLALAGIAIVGWIPAGCHGHAVDGVDKDVVQARPGKPLPKGLTASQGVAQPPPSQQTADTAP